MKLEGITLSYRGRKILHDLNYKESQEKKKKDGTQRRKINAKDWSVGQIGRDF